MFVFFLSDLRWHLSGLSELPLAQRLLDITCQRVFSPFFVAFVSVFCTGTMVQAYYRRASTVLHCREHSTAQHSEVSLQQATKRVRADESATTQVSR